MAMTISTLPNTPRTFFLTSLAIVVILTFATILIQAAPAAQAATPPDNCFEFNTETGTITYYYENEGNVRANPTCTRAVTIPTTIGGVTVSHIGDSAFFAANLTSVDIADSVISIDRSAFRYNLLTTVAFPNSVTSIGQNAFNGNQLTSITMANSILTIGDFSFSDNQLATATLSQSLTSIGYGAFEANQLTSVAIPNAVTTIGPWAFHKNRLSAIAVPDTVTSIDVGAFYSNQLTSLSLPNTLTDIKTGAFALNQLTSLTIPDTVTSIGGSAFAGNHLTSVTIPNAVTSIGDGAFGLNRITSATINGTPILGSDIFDLNGSTFNFDHYSTLQDGTPEGDAAAIQYHRDHITLVPIYTANPSNPAGYIDTTYHSLYDSNNNPMTEPTGGHIVNPATYTATFKGANGATVAPSVMRTGPTLTDYRLGSNPTADFSRYYSVGDTVTIQPPAVGGFTTLAVRQHTLSSTADVVSFIYTPINVTPAPTTPIAIPRPPVTVAAQPVTTATLSAPHTDIVISTDETPDVQLPATPNKPDTSVRTDDRTPHVEQATTPIPWVPIAVGSTVTIGAGWGVWLLVRMRMLKP